MSVSCLVSLWLPAMGSCCRSAAPLGGFHPCCFSAGCVLLYKQDFTKNLGLCCVTCTYCSQTCQRAVTEQLEGSTWDFCSDDCKSKYLLWYYKVSAALLPAPSLGWEPASPPPLGEGSWSGKWSCLFLQ